MKYTEIKTKALFLDFLKEFVRKGAANLEVVKDLIDTEVAARKVRDAIKEKDLDKVKRTSCQLSKKKNGKEELEILAGKKYPATVLDVIKKYL